MYELYRGLNPHFRGDNPSNSMMSRPTSSSLSNFIAISIIDDWLTAAFIDNVHGFETMKIKAISSHINLTYSHEDIKSLLQHYQQAKAKRNERERKYATNDTIFQFISSSFRKIHHQRVRSYLKEVATLAYHNKNTLSCALLRKAVPLGFSDRQVYLFLRQIEYYLRSIFEDSCIFFASTDRYGSTQQLTVHSKKFVKSGNVVPGLLGTTVDINENDEDFIESRRKNWDFSVLTSSMKKGQQQIFLGPARFVNHDCCPNVQFVRLNNMTVGFRALKNINEKDEILTSYGDNYFGQNNAGCKCTTCSTRSISSHIANV